MPLMSSTPSHNATALSQISFQIQHSFDSSLHHDSPSQYALMKSERCLLELCTVPLCVAWR